MRYELFLRGAAALDDEALQTAARRLADFGPALGCEPYRSEGVTRGLDLFVEIQQPEAGRQLCRAAFAIASQQGLTVFDPQLGRPVMEGDAAQIEAQIESVQAFAEGVPLGTSASAAPGLSPSARLWLVIAGLLVAAFVLARGLSCLAA
jgi:hypothetical protein